MGYYDQSVFEGLSVGDRLILVHEKDNEYDKNAVAVFTLDYKKVGYISKNENRMLAEDLGSGVEIYAEIAAKSSSTPYESMKVELWEKFDKPEKEAF